ncbi:MAG: class I SAM-dependent methyltransferase [Promethearchaeia archaeon]
MGHKKSQSNLDFKFMSFFFKIRDFFKSPTNKIEKAEIKLGYIILDYGCGPGSYSIAAAKIVGPSGKIYATDIHPSAIKEVNKRALKNELKNIETIQTDCKTGLEPNSIDVIICFDVLHNIKDNNCILKEFFRVLKPESILSFDDHHMKENEILEKLTSEGLFKLVDKKDNQYNFTKVA